MATQKWASPETVASALATELNSLADGSLSSLSAAIDNSAGLYQYIGLEIALASINPSGTPYVNVFLFASLDGTNYEDGSTALSHALIAAVPCTTGSSAKLMVARNILIPPLKFKLALQNKTGVALAASGSTLDYARYNEQSV